MTSSFEPYDLGGWLQHIDANVLSATECAQLIHVDIEDDVQLAALADRWIRPRYLERDDQ